MSSQKVVKVLYTMLLLGLNTPVKKLLKDIPNAREEMVCRVQALRGAPHLASHVFDTVILEGLKGAF